MAKERVFTIANRGTEAEPDWQIWFGITVADAVMMSDADSEKKTIVDYVNEKISALIGCAPGTYDTLKEIADYIESHKEVATALNAAIGAKADKTVVSTNTDGLMSKADKTKLDGITVGANNYIHPAYAAKATGLYKVTVDATGHVSAVTAVTKADITRLGIPAQDTTYTDATTSASGLMTKDDKTKLNDIAAGANVYTHPATHPASVIQTDSTHKFVTDANIAGWDSKPTIGIGLTYPTGGNNNSLFLLIRN